MLKKYLGDENKIRYIFIGSVFGDPRHLDQRRKLKKGELDAETEFNNFLSEEGARENKFLSDMSMLKEECYKFRLNIDEILDELRNKIRDEEQSDMEIINLINDVV